MVKEVAVFFVPHFGDGDFLFCFVATGRGTGSRPSVSTCLT